MSFSAFEARVISRLGWATPTRIALIIWALTATVMLLAKARAIATLGMIDPDDALRLVQVRDLLGGQSWWDVMQHRINPAGGGGLMHWSRIVDAPLAAIIGALSPIIGVADAERIAAAVWPTMLMLALFIMAARMFNRFGDRLFVTLGLVLLASNYVILYQFAPLRIDHHGWQIAMSLALLLFTFAPAGWRSGVAAGCAAAVHLAISLEGLPSVALFAAIFALLWAWHGDRAERARLFAYLATLVSAAALLQVATRGTSALFQTWCDALSLPYLAALAVAAVAVPLLAAGAERFWPGRIGRLASLAMAGALSGGALLWVEPTCGRGPFGTLDPLVVTYWYAHVSEGLPVWRSPPQLMGFMLAPTIIGLIGTVHAWVQARDAAARRNWGLLLAALAGSALLSLFVLRSASTAQLFALPGCAVAGFAIWRWARAMDATVPRVFGSLLAAIALPPAAGAAMAMPLTHIMPTNSDQDATANSASSGPCVDEISIAALNRMPPTLLMTPLDIGPHLLQRTPHSVVATGHHRNNKAMAATIGSFVGSTSLAEARIRSTGAQMIVLCPTAAEFSNFRDAPGTGFADDLGDGRIPAWLVPVPLGEGAHLKAYRLRPLSDDHAAAKDGPVR